MANMILDEVRSWVGYFYANGEWLERPSKLKYAGREMDDRSADFLNNLLRLLIDGTIINEHTVLWLTSSAPTIKAVVDHYNSTVGVDKPLNFNTVSAKIQYDKKKVEKYFTSRDFINILAYPDKYVDAAMEKLDSLNRIYMNDTKFNKGMVIRLPKDKICRSVDGYTWSKLENLIETYSKRKIEDINNGEDSSITDDMIGYYNYLISSNKLSDVDMNRLKRIKELLGVE